ncbi:SGNH/GDSL hydrolase family protein [Paenibacillus sp. 1011MAR3C5]|uniref:SGNH/GDSL hydrolase family protein n=1 Tax=Paenibacillus sp. 1011MAR3C5 TaxID=1675787 RepID=UPI000E6C0797|nr:SGNH/GDSL hydrolase family protein [Paenibacillus sp. 1011MAR3C5]RJE88636.1 SGNH/GDSL hydrolase family protein [Paenibacillus sp. 1011MAR3C5]
MANRYCNLVGVNRISEDYPSITEGFDGVQRDMDAATAGINDVQAQVDTLVINGDSSPAAAQAAVDANGHDYKNLKVRLDTEHTQLKNNKADRSEVNALATEKANQIDLNATNVVVAQKADQTYVDEQIANIGDGSPKETFATFAELQTTYPTGAIGVYLVAQNGHWYYWNGTAWTDGGEYQSDGLADKSVTPKKLSFLPVVGKVGRNLFNKDDVVLDRYINWAAGDERANTAYVASVYIPVDSNTTYNLNHSEQLAWYAADRSFVSGVNKSGNGSITITSPATARFIRISVLKANLNIVQLEKGSIATAYESYVMIDDNKIQNESIAKEKLAFEVVVPITSKNLFYKDKITTGYYIGGIDGVLKPNPSYSVSDFIQVAPDTFYTRNFVDLMTIYNSEKIGISFTNTTTGTATFKIPPDGYFIRVSLPNTRLNSYQIEEGEETTEYEKAGSYLTPSYFDSATENALNNLILNPTHKTIHSIMSPIRKNNGLQIKLIGDSITQGVGGTGFAQDGYNFVGDYRVNTKGYCWANLLRDYLQEKFICTVKNWGTTGRTSRFLVENILTLVESTDDIVICMIGTNNRNQSAGQTIDQFYDDLIYIGNYVRGLGKEIIFMSSIPASISNETDVNNPKTYHMEDIDTVIMCAAAYFSMDYISLYKILMSYCDQKGITIDSLLGDGLHPNDDGYTLMFNFVCDGLGIGRKRPNATW